jgi:hypothetical protein
MSFELLGVVKGLILDLWFVFGEIGASDWTVIDLLGSLTPNLLPIGFEMLIGHNPASF